MLRGRVPLLSDSVPGLCQELEERMKGTGESFLDGLEALHGSNNDDDSSGDGGFGSFNDVDSGSGESDDSSGDGEGSSDDGLLQR